MFATPPTFDASPLWQAAMHQPPGGGGSPSIVPPRARPVALDAHRDHAAAFCPRRAAAEAARIGPPPGLEPPTLRPPGAFEWPAAVALDEPMKVSALASAPTAMEPRAPPQHNEQQRSQGRPPPAQPQGTRAPRPAGGKQRAPPPSATLVVAYFPRAASDEDVCRALDGAVGKANSVRRCEVRAGEGGLYGFFEFADAQLAEAALDACNRGTLIMRDSAQKKWYLHASRARRAAIPGGLPAGQRGRARAPRARHGKPAELQPDSDGSTAPPTSRYASEAAASETGGETPL
ncbi:unnamed protein product [Prorocentrum cordatum]|uniref:RRM domain-containing protein n=1 Tax=Prorocentrum cordatum TaxID=2364126 RepID=A0ABN9XJU9_9DINO|nr:unnamed protein product [Polarella glacialis]